MCTPNKKESTARRKINNKNKIFFNNVREKGEKKNRETALGELGGGKEGSYIRSVGTKGSGFEEVGKKEKEGMGRTKTTKVQ